MKPSFKKLLLLFSIITILSIACTPHAKASGRSWKSWFIEQYFWLKRDKSYYKVQDESSFQKYLNASREQSDKGYYLDPNSVNGGLVQERLFDMQVYSWNDNGKAN